MAYDKKIDMNKEDPELILGRMRCLEALGEWYVISHVCCEFNSGVHFVIFADCIFFYHKFVFSNRQPYFCCGRNVLCGSLEL